MMQSCQVQRLALGVVMVLFAAPGKRSTYLNLHRQALGIKRRLLLKVIVLLSDERFVAAFVTTVFVTDIEAHQFLPSHPECTAIQQFLRVSYLRA